MSNYTYLFKFIIIGDTGVGKSCILLQFVEETMRDIHDVTIGVEYGTKQFSLNGDIIKLQIWDTAGQESYRSLVRSYYRSAIGALLVYDITKKESFHNLQIWIEEIKSSTNKNIVTILCGNKVDMEAERQVSTDEGQQFATANNMQFIETSAKTGTNIKQAFESPCRGIVVKLQNKEIDPADDGVKIGKRSDDQIRNKRMDENLKLSTPNKKQGCC